MRGIFGEGFSFCKTFMIQKDCLEIALIQYDLFKFPAHLRKLYSMPLMMLFQLMVT